MRCRNNRSFEAIALCLCGVSCLSAFSSPLVVNPGVYEITTETLLPHLEENLRYATTRQKQCLGTQGASNLFPILRQKAFADCDLIGGQTVNERSNYTLVCRNPEAATGYAQFAISPFRISGVLDLKMGGKNMTLSQIISGPRLGACESMK